MSQKATIRQADLTRALKAAAKAGYAVKVVAGEILFLPIPPGAALPSEDQEDAAWSGAMAKWRHSA